jgi:hypothetical protein
VRHFAAEARVLDAAELRDITTPKRCTLLLSLIARGPELSSSTIPNTR